jgi:heme/copper-type cytochrome/quinol oxidase subunit 2
MIYVVVIILLGVLAIWGVSEGMQNYAMAKQAEATVETAKAAQIASTGNLLVILLVVIVILALMAAVVYGMVLLNKRRDFDRGSHKGSPYPTTELSRGRQLRTLAGETDVSQLMQLMQLQIMSRMAGIDMAGSGDPRRTLRLRDGDDNE